LKKEFLIFKLLAQPVLNMAIDPIDKREATHHFTQEFYDVPPHLFFLFRCLTPLFHCSLKNIGELYGRTRLHKKIER
jgi:hypothetical protein